MMRLEQKHLRRIYDLSPADIEKIFKLTDVLKLRTYSNDSHMVLKGKTLGMLFQKPSTRTRVSFETGMTQLGGHAIYLGYNDVQLGRGETIADFSAVVSRYVDGIMARVFSHDHIDELADNSHVPVINGLSDKFHPCQGLTDLYTMREYVGELPGKKLVFVGDGNNNVTHSLMYACSKLDVEMTVACPKSMSPDKKVLKESNERNVTIQVTDKPLEAVKGADVIYTDVWVSMGREEEKAKRLKEFKPYQVNRKLVKAAGPDVKVMHCLPAHRGEELTSDVMDDKKHSIVFEQAENRLHVQKALMALLM